MELTVSINNDSLSIPIKNPFNLDRESVVREISEFIASKGAALNGLDINSLLPKMVRGIAGCEGGCPANALQLVNSGFKNFEIAYIEGGILTARFGLGNGSILYLKMFPDF